VKKCLNKETNIEYAAKYIRKRRGGGRRGAKMEDIKKEVDILHQIDHPNIPQVLIILKVNVTMITCYS
jgi:death-associated protein kinase